MSPLSTLILHRPGCACLTSRIRRSGQIVTEAFEHLKARLLASSRKLRHGACCLVISPLFEGSPDLVSTYNWACNPRLSYAGKAILQRRWGDTLSWSVADLAFGVFRKTPPLQVPYQVYMKLPGKMGFGHAGQSSASRFLELQAPRSNPSTLSHTNAKARLYKRSQGSSRRSPKGGQQHTVRSPSLPLTTKTIFVAGYL